MPEISTKDLLHAITDSFGYSDREEESKYPHLQKEDVDYILDGRFFTCSEY